MFKINKAGMGWQFKDKKIIIKASDVKSMKWVHLTKSFQLYVKQKGGSVVQFDGFRGPDYESISEVVTGSFPVSSFPKEELSTQGWHWGEVRMGKGLHFMVGDKKAFEIPLANISQATQMKDDVQMIFAPHEDATGVTPSLVELRLTFPEGGTLKGELREGQQKPDPVTDAKFFQELVLQETDVSGGNESKLVDIPKLKLSLPRGRFDLELYPRHAKLVGGNPYRIPYENVSRMYHLPNPKGDSSVVFILSMEPPIRRGQTVYQHIIMELPTDDQMSLDLTLTDEQLNQYQGQLNRQMKGKTSSLIARLFKVLTDKKVTIPGGSFKSVAGNPMIPCSVAASTGHLYLLERSMFFIDKPAINIMYDQIEQIEFQRHSQVTSNRNFDLEVRLKGGKTIMVSGRPKTSVTFSHIAREERNSLINLFRQKEIKLKGLREEKIDLKEMLGGDSDDDDLPKDSEDGDHKPAPKRAAPSGGGEGGGGDDDEEDDSSFGSQKSSESDELEYASKASSDDEDEGGGSPSSKKAKKDDDDDDDE